MSGNITGGFYKNSKRIRKIFEGRTRREKLMIIIVMRMLSEEKFTRGLTRIERKSQRDQEILENEQGKILHGGLEESRERAKRGPEIFKGRTEKEKTDNK